MEFAGRKVTQDQGAANKYNLEYIESKPEKGLSADPAYIHQGSNSGYQAINLAYHLGAKRIVLLGYDMQPTGGKSHWFGNHRVHNPSPYPDFIRAFSDIPAQLPNIGLEIINCTRTTALHCFKKQELANIL